MRLELGTVRVALADDVRNEPPPHITEFAWHERIPARPAAEERSGEEVEERAAAGCGQGPCTDGRAGPPARWRGQGRRVRPGPCLGTRRAAGARRSANAQRERRAARTREARAQGQAARPAGRQVLTMPPTPSIRAISHGGKIRRIYCTAEQLAALNRGELGVVQRDGRYLLVSRDVAEQAGSLLPRPWCFWSIPTRPPTMTCRRSDLVGASVRRRIVRGVTQPASP